MPHISQTHPRHTHVDRGKLKLTSRHSPSPISSDRGQIGCIAGLRVRGMVPFACCSRCRMQPSFPYQPPIHIAVGPVPVAYLPCRTRSLKTRKAQRAALERGEIDEHACALSAKIRYHDSTHALPRRAFHKLRFESRLVARKENVGAFANDEGVFLFLRIRVAAKRVGRGRRKVSKLEQACKRCHTVIAGQVPANARVQKRHVQTRSAHEWQWHDARRPFITSRRCKSNAFGRRRTSACHPTVAQRCPEHAHRRRRSNRGLYKG